MTQSCVLTLCRFSTSRICRASAFSVCGNHHAVSSMPCFFSASHFGVERRHVLGPVVVGELA